MKSYKKKSVSKSTTTKSYTKNKYAFGGTVQDRLNDYLQTQTSRLNDKPNLIQTPDAALVENDIAMARVAQNVANSTMGKVAEVGSVVGGMALNYGTNMALGGIKNGDLGKLFSKSGAKSSDESFKLNDTGFNALNSNSTMKTPTMESGMSSLTSIASNPLYTPMKFPKMAMGGVVAPQNVNVEAEGGEMVQLPGEATATKIEGPSHEQGGVDMTLPQNSQVYSKRIGKLDKSYSQRKEARDVAIKKLQAQLDKDPTNELVRKALERTISNEAKIDAEDISRMEAQKMQMQYEDNPDAMNLGKSSNQIDQALDNSEKQYAAYGGIMNPPKKKFFTTNYDDPYNPVIETSYKDQHNNQEANQADLYNKMFNPNIERNNNIKDWADTTSSPISKYSMPMPSLNGANNYEKVYNIFNTPSYKQDTGEYDTTVNTDNGFRPPQQEIDENPFNDTLPQSANSDLSNYNRPEVTNATTPTTTNTNKSSKGVDMVNSFLKGKNGITFGDALGTYGQIKGAFDPMKNTLANRAGDTVNSNFYKDYGKNAISTMQDSKRMLMSNKDQAILDAQSQYTNLGARSANVMNSLKLVEQMGKNQNITNANLNYANQKNAIQAQIAGMQNQQDQMVMQGEDQAVTKNQQDRDNFNKQMAKDIETKNFATQKIGSTLNQIKERNVNLNLMDQLYEDFGINGMTGQMRRKVTETMKTNPKFYNDLSREDGDIIHKGIGTGEFVVKNDRLYDKNGVELDKKTRQPFKSYNQQILEQLNDRLPGQRGYVAPTEEPIPQVTQEQIDNGNGYGSMRFNPVNANPFLTPKLR